MSAVIKGLGVFWSVGGVTFTAGIVTSTSGQAIQSIRFSRTSEKTEIKDNGGVIKAQVFHGFKKTLSITVVPTSISGTNTIANARSSMDAHCLTPGTTITIIDANGAVIGPSPSGTSYNLISATQNRTVDGVATVDLELEQGDESNDLTTAVAAS